METAKTETKTSTECLPVLIFNLKFYYRHKIDGFYSNRDFPRGTAETQNAHAFDLRRTTFLLSAIGDGF